MDLKVNHSIRKWLLMTLTICMTVCQLTPVYTTYALEEEISEEAEVVILEEDESLREESSKTFILSDHTYQKAIYSIPVHYEENGEWKEIDNTFIDDGLPESEEEVIDDNSEESFDESSIINEQQTEITNSNQEADSSVIEENENVSEMSESEENIEVVENDEALVEENNSSEIIEDNIETTTSESDDSQVVGYQNKQGKFKIKFSKKVHSKNMVSIKDGDYKVTWGFRDYKNKNRGVIQTKEEDTNDPINAAYNKVAQSIVYKDVIDGIDLVYSIDSLQVKEYIIINQKTDISEFTFEYKVNKLDLKLNGQGEIEARNEDGKLIFVMPKPYMYDDSGSHSNDVNYEIVEKNNKYLITIVADEDWLNSADRVYPITIDPVIKTQTTQSAIDTTFIASGWANTNFSGFEELLVGKESSAYINCRTLIKFTLPNLNRGDVIVDATLAVASFDNSFYTSSTPDLQVNAHRITSSWSMSSVTWNTKPSYEGNVQDYDYIKKSDKYGQANWKYFDITHAVKLWYAGTANHGIMLKSYNESGSYATTGVKGYIWPERYNSSTGGYPYISLTYRNNKGIESYWDFTSFSTPSAGDAYINTYSGNPVIIHSDTYTQGSVMPVGVAHVFNGYMAGVNNYNAGKGWQLNVQTSVKPSTAYGLTGASAQAYPYTYMDSDGTEHYFVKIDNKYIDEDGLGLELTITQSGYTIKDKTNTVMTFDSDGNIVKTEDSKGNEITYSYSNNKISQVTAANGESISFSYNSNGNLSEITNNTSGKVVSYSYTGDRLTQITYPDGKTSQYLYDSDGALIEMISSNNYKISFTYTTLGSGKQVSMVKEYGSNGMIGQTIKFTRKDYNKSIVLTSGLDNQIDTDDDYQTAHLFDDGGRITCIYAVADGTDLGAVDLNYSNAVANDTKSDIKTLNKLNEIGKLSKTAQNILVNHGGESTSSWVASQSVANATFTFSSTNEESLYGQKSFKINATSCSLKGRSRFYQDIGTSYIKPNTTYTASGYIKTEDVSKISGATDYGAALIIHIDAPSMPNDVDVEAADFVSEYVIGTTDPEINDGWQRVTLTFTTPSDVTNVRFNGVIRNATGTAYFDGLQLEEGNAASPYNMLENSSFERSDNNKPTSWTSSNTSSNDIVSANYARYSKYSLKFTSSIGVNKNYSQTVNINGSEKDTYILSGWVVGKIVKPTTSKPSHFNMSVTVVYSDGTQKKKDPVELNKALFGWQYGTTMFDLSDGTDAEKTPVQIIVYCNSYNQPNTLYFDHLHLTKTKVTQNKYDDEGNLISSDGIEYTYENGNIKTKTDREGKVTSYSYDSNDNLVSYIEPTGIQAEYTYDVHGNNTSTIISDENHSKSIITRSEFDTTGTYLTKSIDVNGRESSYMYDTTNGTLTSFTNSKGVTTSYTYNENNQLLSTSIGQTSVDYTYDSNDRLSQITSQGAIYGFAYDQYSNPTTIAVGQTILSTNIYETNNGKTLGVQYGNDYVVSYEYDHYGNIVQVKENDVVISETTYDSLGQIYEHFDYKAGTKTKYDYDPRGNLLQIENYDLNKGRLENAMIYGIMFGYDENDRLIKETSYVGNQEFSKTYSYGEGNEITDIEYGNGSSVEYGYDSLKRITSKTINNLTINYEYAPSLLGDVYTTYNIQKETIDGKEYIYTYDEVGNIIKIETDDAIIEYDYDQLNQLIREDNGQIGKTITYTYDSSGNILNKKEYDYTTNEPLSSPIKTITYAYNNTNWKDQLTSYNGQTITYDAIGNPLTYRGKTFTWNGRELLSIESNSDTINYTYDADGIRKTKIVDNETITYDYVGQLLIHEERNNSDLYYEYDASGHLIKITYQTNNNINEYYVTTNSRGDVEAIYNTNGVLQARYVYDSWGKIVSVLDINDNQITDTNHIGHMNPIRYRGYYYDTETGFYYVSSRYYDPEVGRFINADSQLNGGEGPIGYNMYAYCNNNPVMYSDPTGHLPFFAITAAIGAAVGAVIGGVKAAKAGKSVWKGALKGAAVGGLIGLGAGAAGAALITGHATATTAAVLGTASVKLAATGTAAGMAASKGIDYLARGYEKASSAITGATNVYRSISSAEAANIMSTNQFNFPAGGMEAKQFAFSYGEALKFGSQSIINQTSIVSASVPNSMLNQFYLHNVDYGIFTGIMTVDYETIGLFNEAVAGTIRIMP